MKKNLYNMIKISVCVLAATVAFSCNDFFDIVPENAPDIDDAFSNRTMLERGLYSAYSYLPDPTNPFHYPAYYTTKGEFEYGISEHMYNLAAPKICRGEQVTSSPLLDYWSGTNGGSGMFNALRWCNIFLESAHIPRDIHEEERERWIAEVKFLKAYYHFFLLQLYGPVPLVKENFPLSATPEEVKIYREPVDECIDYIVQLIDEASADLPLTITNTTQEMGRITLPVALGIKAKVLAWAASPLLNGNPYYSKWRDNKDRQLVSEQYSKEKWVRARDAVKEAIDVAHEAGHALFEYNKMMDMSTINMNDSLVKVMTIRKAITQKWNVGVIWSSTEKFASGKGGFAITSSLGNMQRDLFPVLHSQDRSLMMGYCPASFEMAELYYSKNGVPIEEDKEYNYDSRYELRRGDESHQTFIVRGEETARLNFDREYRFYAGLGFDRGYYETSVSTTDQGKSFSTSLRLRSGETGNLVNSIGYYVKKIVSYESHGTMGTSYPNYVGDDYRFPLLRLSDLYLLYSEVLNEVKDQPDQEVYQWIDYVRTNAGLKGVVESWKNYSMDSFAPENKDKMRDIIHRERMIELAFEGQRFWDVRRWHKADEWFTQTPKCWNKFGKTAGDYYTLLNFESAPKFTEKDYLWPISIGDLRINNNLVQTWGW